MIEVAASESSRTMVSRTEARRLQMASARPSDDVDAGIGKARSFLIRKSGGHPPPHRAGLAASAFGRTGAGVDTTTAAGLQPQPPAPAGASGLDVDAARSGVDHALAGQFVQGVAQLAVFEPRAA